MAVADELPQLECGRTTEEVWAGIGRPPDTHERSCEYCQQARRDLLRLQDAVDSEHRLAEDDTDAPSSRVKVAIMEIARNEIRQGRRIPLEQTAPPTEDERRPEAELAISERALTELVLSAADGVDAVRARRVRLTPGAASESGALGSTGSEDLGSEPSAATIAITMTVSARAGARIPETVAVLRDRITDIVAERVGLGVDRVDITVEDVHD